MRAFELAMLLIFINAGIYIVADIGVFGPKLVGVSLFGSIVSAFSISVPGLGNWVGTTIMLGTVTVISAASSYIGSKIQSVTGAAMWIFYFIYWFSFLNSVPILYTMGSLLGGSISILAVFSGIYVLTFIYTIIQMGSGGQKSFA